MATPLDTDSGFPNRQPFRKENWVKMLVQHKGEAHTSYAGIEQEIEFIDSNTIGIGDSIWFEKRRDFKKSNFKCGYDST